VLVAVAEVVLAVVILAGAEAPALHLRRAGIRPSW
jgi:hypothetical protein